MTNTDSTPNKPARMERLQAALEKARVQREQLAQDGNAPVARPQSPARKAPRETAPDRKALWDAIRELEPDRRALSRKRITAVEGGADAAPFDLLRTRLLQQARHHGWRRIAIVSPHAGCGKSTATANLAFSLGRQWNIYSMVFDFDLRRAGLTRILGQHPVLGMAEVLDNRAAFEDHARRYSTNVIFGLNSATKPRNPSEILQSTQTSEILDQFSKSYEPDLMLFDMPPLMSSDDNFGFLQNVDAALIMVAADKTTMSQIDVAERQVAELTNVMGIVLNKCRHAGGPHGHEYDYY